MNNQNARVNWAATVCWRFWASPSLLHRLPARGRTDWIRWRKNSVSATNWRPHFCPRPRRIIKCRESIGRSEQRRWLARRERWLFSHWRFCWDAGSCQPQKIHERALAWSPAQAHGRLDATAARRAQARRRARHHCDHRVGANSVERLVRRRDGGFDFDGDNEPVAAAFFVQAAAGAVT